MDLLLVFLFDCKENRNFILFYIVCVFRIGLRQFGFGFERGHKKEGELKPQT